MPPVTYYDTTVTDTNTLLTQYIAHLKRENAVNTVNTRKHTLYPFFKLMGFPLVTDITFVELDESIDQYTSEHNLVTSSVSTLKQRLKSFFKWCWEYKEIQLKFNPNIIKRKKIKPKGCRTFNKDEVARVIAACKEEQDALMISLMFETGMRIGEIINLCVEDINLLQITIRGKGEVTRTIHISPELSRAMREYRIRKMVMDGHVFRPLQQHNSHPSDWYTTDKTVRYRIKRIFKQVLDIEMHPHQLRHSFAVEWLRSGGDIRTLQIILGHENIETTMWYLQLTDNQVGEQFHQILGESVLTKARAYATI